MQEFLDTHNLQAENRTDARKEKIEAAAVWELIGSAERIVVAKGKRIETFVPTEDTQESILKVVLGRSGSLRAPTVRTGDVFFVGYNGRSTSQKHLSFKPARTDTDAYRKDSNYGCERIFSAIHY